MLAGLALAAAGLQAIWLAAPEQLTLPLGLPDLPFHLRLDPLAGYFLMLLGAVSAGVSIYALGYCRDETAGRLALIALEYHVFLASMAFVILADDAYLFMVAWETWQCLPISRHHRPNCRNPQCGLSLPADRAPGRCWSAVFGVGGYGDTFDAARQ